MGEAAEIGAGTIAAPLPTPHPSLAVGYPALLALLETYRVRATFFVEGWNGVHNAGAVADLVGRGHELGMHGWMHENWGSLPADEERALARRATEALTQAAGVAPRGFRAPGGSRSAFTAEILHELGYLYDASLGDPTPTMLPPGIAQIPFVWPLVDGYYYFRREPLAPAVLRRAWLEQLDQTAASNGFFISICHAFLTGIDAERRNAFADVLQAAVSDPRIEILTVGELAGRTRQAAAS
jgi:peptidoglycan/xylan/chitin deacetylase (PgdA/CDA1 family)